MRAATVQYRPSYKDASANLERIGELFHQAVEDHGAEIALFPECAMTGYCFDTKAEAMDAALDADHPTLRALEGMARERGRCLVVGYLERVADHLFNSAAFYGPAGLIGIYRKTHMPFIGADRFATAGNSLRVYETPLGRFGILICYDLRFPEAALTLALQGMDALLIPTNWPEGADAAPAHLVPARAWETRCFAIAANRVGPENGFDFIGKSGIWDMSGKPLLSADHRDEAILAMDIDLEKTKNRRIVIRPGEYEMDPLHDRRTDLYRLPPCP